MTAEKECICAVNLYFEGYVFLKMPDKIENIMLAPCGVNCMVCYKHVQIRKKKQAMPRLFAQR